MLSCIFAAKLQIHQLKLYVIENSPRGHDQTQNQFSVIDRSQPGIALQCYLSSVNQCGT